METMHYRWKRLDGLMLLQIHYIFFEEIVKRMIREILGTRPAFILYIGKHVGNLLLYSENKMQALVYWLLKTHLVTSTHMLYLSCSLRYTPI